MKIKCRGEVFRGERGDFVFFSRTQENRDHECAVELEDPVGRGR